MGRTANILGRVLRNLRKFGVTTSDITDEEVYDELTQVQNRIMSEVQPGKVITITLAEDTASYQLSTDTGTITRENIAELKLLKFPSTWTYRFELLSNKEFIDRVNANPNTTIVQPVIGTVMDGYLKMYPTPDSTYDGDELEFWASLKSSTQDIDKDTEPELPNTWDKALEWGSTAELLDPKNAASYTLKYEAELKRLRPVEHRNNHPKQKENAFDLLPQQDEILRYDVWE